MRLSSKITGEFIGVFLIGTLVGALAFWDWAAIKEHTLIGIGTGEATPNPGDLASTNESSLSSDAKLAQFMSRTNDPDKMIARINEKYATDYHLSPEELQRIQPLIQDMAQKVSKIRHQFGVDIITELDTDHQKIAEQLNPEHRAPYLQSCEERKKQLRIILLLDPVPPAPIPAQK